MYKIANAPLIDYSIPFFSKTSPMRIPGSFRSPFPPPPPSEDLKHRWAFSLFAASQTLYRNLSRFKPPMRTYFRVLRFQHLLSISRGGFPLSRAEKRGISRLSCCFGSKLYFDGDFSKKRRGPTQPTLYPSRDASFPTGYGRTGVYSIWVRRCPEVYWFSYQRG